MLFRRQILAEIAAGRVDLAFRRWRRAAVAPGGTQLTAAGVIGFGSVQVVGEDAISDREARRAGAPDRSALLADMAGRPGVIHRIELRLIGPDPRVALARRATLDERELAALQEAVADLDRRSRRPPWTDALIAALAHRPGVPARVVAAALGQEPAALKRDVRRLKELGLTESLGTGYRLSPRGEALRAAPPAHGGP